MADKGISYLNRNFDDYKQSLKEYIAQYYPQIANDFNDASVGSWMVDMVAAVADNLSYYIDRAYNETNIDSAQQSGSLYNIARSNGLKIPGPKGAVALCHFSCQIPYSFSDGRSPYLPLIKKGTKVASSDQVFEVMHDIDFNHEFDYNGFPNRDVIPLYDSNNRIVGYNVTKKEVVCAGESKVYRQVLNSTDSVYPFMEIVIPDNKVMGVESIIVMDGTDFQSDPPMGDFMINKEVVRRNYTNGETGNTVYRFFEVDSLAESYRWGDDVTVTHDASKIDGDYTSYEYGSLKDVEVVCEGNRYEKKVPVTTNSIVRGEWLPLRQKFITEYTDNGYLKVIFGGGYDEDFSRKCPEIVIDDFTKYQMSKILKNDYLGVLPKTNSTLYILYRTGGGASSNVAAGAINRIVYLNALFECFQSDEASKYAQVKNSITVTNPYPSVTGKDAPSEAEIRALIKYNNGALNRCVTVKDYEAMVMKMPSRYGCPFRVSAREENNKVMLYVLGLTHDGKLSDAIPEQLADNIVNYLSMYRTINDYVEVKVGKIINISVEVDVYIDKNYYVGDVMTDIINTVKDYMDINKHQMGESIYVSTLSKNITNVTGVLNIIDLRIYNEYSNGYSSSRTTDPIITEETDTTSEERDQIDLFNAKYTLNIDSDSMYEIKYPESDIVVKAIAR